MSLITDRDSGYCESRATQTIDFCDMEKGSKVLDIASSNKLSQRLAREKEVDMVNTTSDLDYSIIPEKKITPDYVTCFEVIEHLLNPRCFLDNLHNNTPDDIVLYLSYPSRPKFLWNNREHFHEYDKLRFNFLLKRTKWRIVKSKKIYTRVLPTGIRPLIRNFIPVTVIYKIVKL
jgi:hypothetical protein